MLLERRKFLTGLGALIAAPAVVRAASLMPVRGIVMPVGSIKSPVEHWRYYTAGVDFAAGGKMACVLMASMDQVTWTVVDDAVVSKQDGRGGFTLDLCAHAMSSDQQLSISYSVSRQAPVTSIRNVWLHGSNL